MKLWTETANGRIRIRSHTHNSWSRAHYQIIPTQTGDHCLLISLFTQSCNKYLWSTYYVPSTVPGSKATSANRADKQTNAKPLLSSLYSIAAVTRLLSQSSGYRSWTRPHSSLFLHSHSASHTIFLDSLNWLCSQSFVWISFLWHLSKSSCIKVTSKFISFSSRI